MGVLRWGVLVALATLLSGCDEEPDPLEGCGYCIGTRQCIHRSDRCEVPFRLCLNVPVAETPAEREAVENRGYALWGGYPLTWRPCDAFGGVPSNPERQCLRTKGSDVRIALKQAEPTPCQTIEDCARRTAEDVARIREARPENLAELPWCDGYGG